MKISCPKCHATYSVNLPESSQEDIDVQCGKCLHIFQFRPSSDLAEERPSEPILPPQKDEDQEVSDIKKGTIPALENDPETSEELELEPILDDPEPIEIVVDSEIPDDSLETEALEDIWNQAVEEGARTVEKSKEKTSTPPSEVEDADLEEQVMVGEEEATLSWEEAFADQAQVESGWRKAQEQDRIQEEQQLAEALNEKSAPEEPPAENKADSAPQDDLQSLVKEIFAEAKVSQESLKEPEEKPQPESEAKSQEEKPEKKVDLVEPSTNDEEEAIPSWEEAFADQTKVESGWKKAQQEDRIHEEQQLAEALGETYDPSDTTAKATETTEPQEDKQNQVDQLFAEGLAHLEALEQFEANPQDGPENVSGDEASSSEIEETHVDQHTIPGAIDLMTDLDNLNMQQLVAQDFREGSETQEGSDPPLSKGTTPGDEEIVIPELIMESASETPPEAEPPPADTDPELEMELISDLTLESAEEEPEIELEMESKPESSGESPEEAVPSTDQPAMSPEALYDKEREGIWTDLLSNQNGETEPDNEKAPAAVPQEEKPFGGDDFWDQVLEKGSQEPQTSETEGEDQPVSSIPEIQDTAERETLTDEELWKQAFPGEEELEPAASQSSGEENEDPESKAVPLVFGAQGKQSEDPEDSTEYDEAAHADFDDEEFEFQRRDRKLGPFSIPHGRRGDMVLGGTLVVFLLLAGSVYFTLQTFAPGELTEIQKAETEVPEGLTPREVPLDELVDDLTSPKPEKTPPVDKPGDKGEATLSDPAKILEESPEEKGILKDLAESQILKDTGKAQTARIDQSALQALTGHSVTMSTIMPVAYNPTDIRVLSFSVEMQLSNAQSAKAVRESLPVYEEIINKTVEDFLQRKFYNDVLYVKEKLQKRLQTAMNKSLKNGRVRKTKFTDFAIQ